MPTLNHAILQNNLTFLLNLHYRKTYSILPELNITMPTRPDTVPDIAIYPKLESDFLHDTTSMTQMPITVVEIISPSQGLDEILAKFERYFNAGVQSCWLAMPGFQAISVYTAITEYRFFTRIETLVDPTTNIELPLSEIFA